MSEKCLKIAIVTPYRHYFGGVETVNSLLTRALVSHDVRVVAVEDTPSTTIPEKIAEKFIGAPIMSRTAFEASQQHFDVVICNGEFGFRVNHPHCINLFHGSAYGYLRAKVAYASVRERFSLWCTHLIQRSSARNKHVVCVSKYLEQTLTHQGIKVDHVISNSVDTSHFSPGDSPSNHNGRLLYVGASDYYGKGIDRLEVLANSGVEIDCVTDSKPPQPLGWLQCRNNHELVELYREYSALIFLSRFEGMGLVVLEAMACGLPVLTTPVGMGLELEREIPEFILTDFRVPAVRERVGAVIGSRRHYSDLARRYVEQHYSFEQFASSWQGLVRQIAEGES